MAKRKINLSQTKVIKTLEQTLKNFENPDCSDMKILPFFEYAKNDEKPDNSQEEFIESIKATDLTIKTFKNLETNVKQATLSFNKKDSMIRIIDDANNLIILKGAIRQPFKSDEDIYCQLSVNHKSVMPSDDIYHKIIRNMKGNCLIFKS